MIVNDKISAFLPNVIVHFLAVSNNGTKGIFSLEIYPYISLKNRILSRHSLSNHKIHFQNKYRTYILICQGLCHAQFKYKIVIMFNSFTEDALIEQPALALLGQLGWETANCFDETFGAEGTLGRETKSEVVLLSRLRPALEKLNPEIPPHALNLAIEELMRDRSLMSPAQANREVYDLIKDGIRVAYRNIEGIETVETVKVIDWENPENNDFFMASQFWITGEMYTRRTDLLGFVNGLPLLFIELKASHKRLKNAYDATCAITKTPSRTCSGTTPSSSCPTAARPKSARYQRMGTLQRVEEDQQRGRRRRHLAGYGPARRVRAVPFPGYRRKLHPVCRSPGG